MAHNTVDDDDTAEYRLHLRINESIPTKEGGGVFSYVLHLPFEIRQGGDVVGKGDALRMLVSSAGEAGYSPAELFDCVDQDVHELYCALFDPKTSELREDIADTPMGDDVLYVQSIMVVPERRGRKLGLFVAQRLRDYFGGGCSVMALRATPLHFDKDEGYDDIDVAVFSKPFASGGEEAKAKLRAYWSALGFQRVDDTDYMTFDLTLKTPVIADAGGS